MVDWLIDGLIQELHSFNPVQLDESLDAQKSNNLDLWGSEY